MVRLNVTLSDNLAANLDSIAVKHETTKSEILRKALTLYELALEGQQEGKRLAMIDRDGRQVTEIVGL